MPSMSSNLISDTLGTLIVARTCSLVGLVPQVAHSIVHFLHLQTVVLHDRANELISNKAEAL
jgi:hypothetical protein